MTSDTVPMSGQCGTRSRYNAGCRCDDCRRAQAIYQRAVRRGETRMIDPTPVRDHVEALLRRGWTWRAIADHAGIDKTVLYRQLLGHSSRMHRRTADALTSIPIRRRDKRAERAAARIENVEFLLDVGESPTAICHRLDVTSAVLQRFLQRQLRPDLAAHFGGKGSPTGRALW